MSKQTNINDPSKKVTVPLTEQQWDTYCRNRGFRPLIKLTVPGGEVHVSECFVEPDRDFPDYPRGHYQVMWRIFRGKDGMGRWLEFDRDHDPLLMNSTRQQARINAAVLDARAFIRDAIEAGYYERG